MFYLFRKMIVLSLSCVAIQCCQLAHADECSAILANGTFDVTSNRVDTHDVRAYLNYLNREESGSSSRSQQKDIDLGATYAGFGGNFGEKTGTTSAQDYKKYLNTLNTSDVAFESHVSDFVSSASRVISDNWLACMNRTGLHASVKYTSNPDEMILIFQFITPGTPSRVTIKRLDYTDNVKCTGDTFPFTVTATQLPFRCVRTGNKPATITIFPDNYQLSSGGPMFSIPGKAVPPYVKRTVNGDLRAEIGNISFIASVNAKIYSDGFVTGTFSYARPGENFRGLVRCINLDKEGYVTFAGPITVNEENPVHDWAVMDIRNPSPGKAGGIRVHGGSASTGAALCVPSPTYDATIKSGEATVSSAKDLPPPPQ